MIREPDVVRIEGLGKSYGSHVALDDLSLRVEAGRLLGFLGPNGAGKSTTLRILLGLVRPTRGRATLLGRDAWIDGPRIRASVGYLPGELRLPHGTTGRRLLRFLAEARRADCATEIRRLCELFDLDPSRRVRDYSSGTRQKLGLVQALMHRPELLVLDEPTAGLDPLVRRTLFAELRRVVGEGRTVLFSSHTLGEVQELCDEVAVLREGHLVEHARVDDLRRTALRRVTVVFRGEPPIALPEDLRELQRQDDRLVGVWTGPTDSLVRWLAEHDVADVVIEPPDLETLFLGYYGLATKGGRK